ncbi:MAG: ABC transporter ATP-binding protein [Gammaproteobacteria bacterium]|nr:ABC transporter ATP-binding protein [Gammaproteobacteria bacterium]
MPHIVDARELRKRYGSRLAVDDASFTIDAGRIVGLVGPNGAGKTSILRAVLGLSPYQGYLRVLGMEPLHARAALMHETCFIADVAVMPSWLRVDQAIEFVAGVHPRFRRERALALLDKTPIKPRDRLRELSKGMKTQVHLALAMAVDAKLLVLDEPTLGLDLLARRSFYDALLNDYMDETRTILISTHQVEEIENLLTDVLLIDQGRVVLHDSLDAIATRFAAVAVGADRLDAARALRPFHERPALGKRILFFDNADREALAALGELRSPSVADLFVAKLSGGSA